LSDVEELARAAVDFGYRVHTELGPGLLESVYEAVLAARLTAAGLRVERQKALPISLPDLTINEGFRVDLLIERTLIIEVKSVERLAGVHAKQLLTYLRLARQPVGLLMNFGGETFREGLKRVVNGPTQFVRTRVS
jgi:GxxExxY protein